ncbi:MAG: hypothetical protein DCC68_18425 [Planctomycetota bacterium]|nr:MAG: hypothetical protein DCC68_18425 [Planctomycetota bacterium]
MFNIGNEASGVVETVTVHDASTGNQTTEYVYAVENVAGESRLYSDDLLHEIEFPGGATAAYLEYNCQGERIKAVDQNGNAQAFTYDQSGRSTNDLVTFANGTATDQTIDEIVTAYDVRCRAFTVTDWLRPDAPDPHENGTFGF